jgi:hypothetical protein
LTLENTKLLVKLLSPETANIKNIFHQKTVPYSPGEGTSSSLRVFTPRGQSTPRTSPTGTPVPVITFTPSLEWDTSCLQDPFSGGQSNLLGIHRLSGRKPSDTDPNLLDSDKIPIVSTDISSLSISLDSSVVRFVEAAGNISSTVVQTSVLASTMEDQAEELLEEVDSLLGRMQINPVSDIEEEFLEDDLLRLETMKNDAENCIRMFLTWERRYKDGMDATLKATVNKRVQLMETDLKAYKLGMAVKKKALRASLPPPSVSMPSANNDHPIIQHLQHEKADEQSLQAITLRNKIQSAR